MWMAWLPAFSPSNATRNGTMPPSGYRLLLPLRFPFCQARSLLAHWSRSTLVPARATAGAKSPTATSIDATMNRVPILWRPDMARSPMLARSGVSGRARSRCRVAQGSHGVHPGCHSTTAEVSDGWCAARCSRCDHAPMTRRERWIAGRERWISSRRSDLGSDLDAEDRQHLSKPHGGGEAAGGDREGESKGTFEAHASIAAACALAVVPERIAPTESGDHGFLRGGSGDGHGRAGLVPLTTLTSRPVPGATEMPVPATYRTAGITSLPYAWTWSS